MSITGKALVLIGRCEPPHLGHFHLVSAGLQKAEYVILLLGSSGRARNTKNPFTFEERRQIFMDWAELQAIHHRLIILPLRDFPYNNSHWIHQVQLKVKTAVDKIYSSHGVVINEIALTGSDRDDSTWYLHAFPQWKTEFLDPFVLPGNDNVNATSVREALFSNKSVGLETLHPVTVDFLVNFRKTHEFATLKAEYDFMKQYMAPYATLRHPPIFVTVDAVIVQSGHLLMVKRANLPGNGLWALPGGHLDPKERIRNAIARETTEETGIRLAEGKRAKDITEEILMRCTRDVQYFDDPNRSLRGRTVTHAGFIRLDDTKPLPHVTGQNMPLHETGGAIIPETSKAAWIPMHLIGGMMDQIFEDHLDIIEVMTGTTYGVV